jgi:hypothetical protein
LVKNDEQCPEPKDFLIMHKTKRLLTAIMLTVLCSIAVEPAYAQSAEVVWAEVNRSYLSSDETLLLRITVQVGRTAHHTEPITIEISQGTGQPQQSSQAQSQLQNFFNMPGIPNIPGFPSFPSIPGMPDFPSIQDVEIVPMSPSEAPADLAGNDFYAEARVDNDSPYQGEQLIYTFRFYQAQELLDQPNFQKPAYTGLWSHPETKQTEYSLNLGEKSYRVSEIQTVLFPTVAGEVTIDPATIAIPDGLFTQGGTFTTQPVELNVKPLPDHAPKGYRGAIGKFDFTTEIDTTETRVNEAVSLKVTLSGQGNIETLPDLEWPENSQWRAFDSQAVTETRFEDGVLGGARLYERTLIPTTAGNFTLPPVEFSYFDPESESYQTISSDPIAVTVAADPLASQPISPVEIEGGSNLDLAPQMTELRPIKSTWTADSYNNTLLTQKAGYWLLWIVPLLFLVGQFTWQQRRKKVNANPKIQRDGIAAKTAQQEIHKARQNPEEARDAVGDILSQYLADRLNQPLTGQTRAGVSALLSKLGIEAKLVERVQVCLTLADSAKYAPINDRQQTGDLLDESEALISQLEKVLK